MIFDSSPIETGNFYDILDITPSASPTEVRAAYLRAKSAFNKDSVALYSLIDAGERDTMLRKIEEAYEILSNEHKRREYDDHHGIIENTGTLGALPIPPPAPVAKVLSIDRSPPMDLVHSADDLLVAPPTDFGSEVTSNPPPASAPQASDIEREMLGETEWRGSFLRRVREAQSISLEELSNVTKISKTYLQAIELEDFKKLPALVFVRGFLIQVCRVLKVSQDKVLEPYLERYKIAKAAD